MISDAICVTTLDCDISRRKYYQIILHVVENWDKIYSTSLANTLMFVFDSSGLLKHSS